MLFMNVFVYYVDEGYVMLMWCDVKKGWCICSEWVYWLVEEWEVGLIVDMVDYF